MMTLEQFRATGRDVDDLAAEHPGLDLDGIAGRIYVGPSGPYVERHDDGWHLILGNSEYVGSLAELEPLLYDWAASEDLL